VEDATPSWGSVVDAGSSGGCYVAVAVAPVTPDAVEDLVNGLGAVRLTDVDSGVRVRVSAPLPHFCLVALSWLQYCGC
jgi:hypothetical protein